MPGSFVHLELNTDDTDRAKEFYRDLFGWNYNEWPMGDSIYWGVKTPEPPGGGIQTNPMPHAPSQWIPYISVDDVHASVERARSAGAEIIVDFMPIQGSGELAILRDPSGATVGLWKQIAPTPTAAAASGKKKSSKKAGKKAGKKKAAKAAAPAKAAKGKKSKKAAAPAAPAKAAKGNKGKKKKGKKK